MPTEWTHPIADPVGRSNVDEHADAALEKCREIVFRAKGPVVSRCLETTVQLVVNDCEVRML